MKKIVALILCLAMVLSVVACGGSKQEPAAPASEPGVDAVAAGAQETTETIETTADTKFKENVIKKSSFTLLYGDNWNIDQKKSFFNGMNFWRRILRGVDISPYYASNDWNAEQAGVCVNIYEDLPTEEWLKKEHNI